MSKVSRRGFPWLAIVGSRHKQMDPKPSQGCFSEHAAIGSAGEPESDVRARSRRVTVMPSLSPRWPLSLLWAAWNLAAWLFSAKRVQSRRAAVLSFRRQGLADLARPESADQNFSGKKASARVSWHGDHQTAPQEEGRG